MTTRPLIWTKNGYEPTVFVCRHILRGKARSAHVVYVKDEGLSENWDFLCDRCCSSGKHLDMWPVSMNKAHKLVQGICEMRQT